MALCSFCARLARKASSRDRIQRPPKDPESAIARREASARITLAPPGVPRSGQRCWEEATISPSRRNQPLESIHGSAVGPAACVSPPRRQSCEPNPWEAIPGHTLPLATSTGDEESQGKCGLAASERIGRPALGTSPSMIMAANHAARALATAAAWLAWPSTSPTKESPAFLPRSSRGTKAFCCSASAGSPAAQLTTRQFTGVPRRISSTDGSSQRWRTSVDFAVKPSFFSRWLMSSGPASQRMGIQVDKGAISVLPPYAWSGRPFVAQSLEIESDFLDGSADHLNLAQIAGSHAELFGQPEFVVAPLERWRAFLPHGVVAHGRHSHGGGVHHVGAGHDPGGFDKREAWIGGLSAGHAGDAVRDRQVYGPCRHQVRDGPRHAVTVIARAFGIELGWGSKSRLHGAHVDDAHAIRFRRPDRC